MILGVCKVVNGLLNLFHFSPSRIHELWEKDALLAKNESATLYVDFTDRNPLSWCATKDEVFPLRKIQFEDMVAPLPNKYDVMLRRSYGDYMKLPPVEDRKNHYPSKLDFGKYQ